MPSPTEQGLNTEYKVGPGHPPIEGRWKPGQSGNPGGRPKKKPITAALERIFDKLSDAEVEVFARSMFMKAGQGDVAAFKEITDRMEGKVAQPVGGADDLPPIGIEKIVRAIVDPQNRDGESISPST